MPDSAQEKQIRAAHDSAVTPEQRRIVEKHAAASGVELRATAAKTRRDAAAKHGGDPATTPPAGRTAPAKATTAAAPAAAQPAEPSTQE